MPECYNCAMLDWTKNIRSSGTPGTLWKAYDASASRYYKAPTLEYERGFTGHEAANEVIVSFLLDRLRIPILRTTWKSAKRTLSPRQTTLRRYGAW